MAKLSHLSLNHSTVHHLRKKSKSKSSIVIQSDNIEDDHVCWWFRCSFLQCRGSRLTLFSMMTDISRYFRIPKWRKAVQVVRKYSTVSVVPSGSLWTCTFIPFNFVWVAFSVVFNFIPEWLSEWLSLLQLNWFHQIQLTDHENLVDYIHVHCRFSRCSWLTMKIRGIDAPDSLPCCLPSIAL